MSRKKRTYQSKIRQKQSEKTKKQIFAAAKKLFSEEGFDSTKIEAIASLAEVSSSTIYTLFKSKKGILRALMDEAFPSEERLELVEQVEKAQSPKKRLAIAAEISQKMYTAEKDLSEAFRGASMIASDLKQLEKEREERRYHRQKETVENLVEEQALAKELTKEQAHDLLWAFTGRDLYRLLVIERGWKEEEYERWLAKALENILLYRGL